MKKLLFFVVFLAGCGYLVLQSHPGLYYGETAAFDNFTLHSSVPLSGDVSRPLAMARERLTTSEFFTPAVGFDVYVAAGPRDYAFFTPLCRDHYACVNPLNGRIMIAPPDLEKNRSLGAPEGEPRDFSAVLAGAAARELVRHKLRPLAYLVLSEWLLRGYSGLVGGTGERVPADICAGPFAEGTLLKDYEYRLAVEFAMTEERINFGMLMEKNYSFENLEDQMRKRYCAPK